MHAFIHVQKYELLYNGHLLYIYIHTQLYTYTLGVYPCCISIVASVLFTLHGRIMRNLNCCCFYLIQFLFYPHVILIDVSIYQDLPLPLY